MRFVVFLSVITAVIVFIYRWRYRILNTLLAISVLRRFVVSLTMSIPGLKSNFFNNLFKQPDNVPNNS